MITLQRCVVPTPTRFFWTFFNVFSRIHGCFNFNQGLIIQPERVLAAGHSVWLCTESPPENGQGCRADSIMHHASSFGQAPDGP